MIYEFLPKFKVVEINNSTALRNGHVWAQFPALAADIATASVSKGSSTVNFLENGIIVGLSADGKIKNYDPEAHAVPALVYTEELISGPLDGLNSYAEQFEGTNPVYPRCLVLYVGDSFTTNNFSGTAADGYAKVVDGVITITSDVTEALFAVKRTNLPNAEDGVALECTYIGRPAVVEE